MGTWHAPKTKAQKKKLRKVTRRLLKAFQALDGCLGDDKIWDYQGMLIDRVKELHRQKWEEKAKV